MSEDAPVNTGAVAWPDDYTASVMVRRMQAKLHRWATGDPGRCFGGPHAYQRTGNPHRMACARCDFYTLSTPSRALLPEPGDNLQPLLARITVIDDEHAGVGAGQTALDRLLAR